MDPVIRRRRVPPPALLAITLLLTIVLGSLLLRLPMAHVGPPISWLDAFFTATSAACITGLVVVDTGTQFSFFGQAVILVLMQIGGLGVMTIGTLVLLALGQRPTVVMHHLLTGLARHQPTIRARDILGSVLLITLGVELCGAVFLFLAFVRTYPVPQALWLAVFHSVSAFCNAGFSLWPDSLNRYAGEWMVNLVIMSLIIIGGLGFVVLVELRTWAASRWYRTGAFQRLSVHSQIILSATAVAIVVGACLILILEGDRVLADRPWGERVLIALFQSVTARTAGFNTVDTSLLTNPTLLIMIVLMFIGAGPGSMAGGIKLTSAATLLALVVQRIRGAHEVRLFGRAIGELTVQRAVVVSVLASLLIGGAICVMEALHAGNAPLVAGRDGVLAVTFEVVSAFGTVGLSMGVTAKLEVTAKLLLMGLMVIGRIGPLALMDFFQHLPPAPPVRYAKEELMVG